MYLPQSSYPIALGMTLVIFAALGAASAYDPETLWAPGDLSLSHRERACMACHEPFRGATSARCRSCHTPAAFQAAPAAVAEPHLVMDERQSCRSCHIEHRGRSAGLTFGALPAATAVNPHSDFIFRVTGAASCRDCHAAGGKGAHYGLLDNQVVRQLVARGKGAHGPGRFADCLRCHAGGHLDGPRP